MVDDTYKVLWVDDEELTLNLCYEVFTSETNKFDLETVTDPTIARERYEEGEYDIVVSDMNMPEMEGYELKDELREIDEELPIIFHTSEVPSRIPVNLQDSYRTEYTRKEGYEGIENVVETCKRLIQ